MSPPSRQVTGLQRQQPHRPVEIQPRAFWGSCGSQRHLFLLILARPSNGRWCLSSLSGGALAGTFSKGCAEALMWRLALCIGVWSENDIDLSEITLGMREGNPHLAEWNSRLDDLQAPDLNSLCQGFGGTDWEGRENNDPIANELDSKGIIKFLEVNEKTLGGRAF